MTQSISNISHLNAIKKQNLAKALTHFNTMQRNNQVQSTAPKPLKPISTVLILPAKS